MKVYLLAEGGKKIGFGHVTRCIAIYQALEEIGLRPEFLINGDDSLRFALQGKRHRTFNWLNEKEKTFSLLAGSDIAIIDSYLAGPAFYRKMSKVVKAPVYIDDNRRLEYPRGLVINGLVYADALKYPRNRRNNYLLGPRYIPLRKEFWRVKSPVLRRSLKKVVISFGGMDRFSLIRDLERDLKDKFDFQVTVINTTKKRVSASKMQQLMLSNDLFISGGGQTTYELARCGIPAIGICFTRNQLRNVQTWGRKGSLKYVGWYYNPRILKIIEDTLRQLDYRRCLKMSVAGRKLVDGQGARRVVREILAYSRKQDRYNG